MIEIVDYPERFAEEPSAKDLRERARARVRRRWLSVESAISGNPWLDVRGPTTADFAIAVVSRWSTGKRWRRTNCPRIEALAASVARRDQTRSAWESHFGV